MYQPECNLVYQYGASGQIFGFTYYPNSGSPSQYFFGKNAQGDVICIYNASGTTVARYNYDAWGACTIEYDNTSIGIANINPIRYRSYYYDTETSLYYLQSRYYDPAVGRFISPDDPSLLGANGDLLSYNLYAYCSNNPVNYSDPSGHFWDYCLDAVFLVWGIIDVVKNPDDFGNWASLMLDVAFAVIPFVPSGVGQIIKAGNKYENVYDIAAAINKLDNLQNVTKVTLIGRGMDRVKGTAALIGKTDTLYQMWKKYDDAATGLKRFGHDFFPLYIMEFGCMANSERDILSLI